MKYFNAWLAAMLLLSACGADDEPQANAAPHWQMSAQYVADTLLKTDASIAEALKYKQIARLGDDDLPDGVYSRYLGMARKMRLRPLPALYLDAEDERTLPQAQARFTREGSALVVVNPAALEAWPPRELVAVLGHELVHLKEKHVTAESLAQAFNHPEISVAHELEADRTGAGPLGSCDPRALESALRIVFDLDRKDYLDKNPLASDNDFDGLTGASHPNREQRLALLDAMAANPPQGCE